ncbi:hypothetical protein [Pseudomonas aeruginosa]|uniref:hypothetical protein n=1 Tax=Pseudomonas aeruginosa TaxID=287 RepID=UPI0022D3CC68|nr:hypothetical protein [Pseudomonas aeruginosa]MDA1452347.1 hypothetical protein [Pseudomonas aeruginosa]
MAYGFKVEPRHAAKIACRLIPSASAIGTCASRRALDEAVEGIADKYEIGGDFTSTGVFYTVEFESDTSTELVSKAARDFTRWLAGRKDFCEA